MSDRNLDSGRRHLYEVYGLQIASSIEIPYLGFKPADLTARNPLPTVALDVQWSEQATPMEPDQLLVERNSGEIRVTYPSVGRTVFRSPHDILFEAEPGANAEIVCQVLLSLTLPIAAALNGLAPIHASAVSTPDGAIVFLGHSGAGKSTTAFALNRHMGWPMMADDVCAISWCSTTMRALVHPGPAVSRLWQKTVDRLQIDSARSPMHRLPNEKLAVDLSQDWRYASADIKAFCHLSGATGDTHSRDAQWRVKTLIESIQVEPIINAIGIVPILAKALISSANKARFVEMGRHELGDEVDPLRISAAVRAKFDIK